MIFELEQSGFDKKSSSVLFVILILCLNLTKLVHACEVHSLKRHFPELIKHLKSLRSYSKSRYEMNFQRLQVEFVLGVITIFVPFLVASILGISFSESKIEKVFGFLESFAIFCNRITICHVYFHILLLKYSVSFFVDYFDKMIPIYKRKPLSDIKFELIFLKINHFKLNDISNNLNASFGWTLISICVQQIVDITNECYGMVVLVECSNIYSAICN